MVFRVGGKNKRKEGVDSALVNFTLFGGNPCTWFKWGGKKRKEGQVFRRRDGDCLAYGGRRKRGESKPKGAKVGEKRKWGGAFFH